MLAVKNLPPWASAAKLDAAKVLASALVTALETGSNSGSGPDQAINLRAEVRRFEENLIRSALKQTGGRQRRAARLLSMNVSSLNSRIKRYRLNASD
jgi:transcriptional regulator with GAF, ATPase, and Fis domain